MKRQKATELVHQVLARAIQGEWPANLVSEIRVFGSYMRGALEPGDVDLAYVMDGREDKRWTKHFVDAILGGGDTQAVMRKALRGSSRSVSLTHFEEGLYDDIPMMTIWRRGEPIETAIARLEGIKPDPEAGRAPRGAMTDAFEGLEKHLPLYVRESLLELEADGGIRMRQIELPDADEDSLDFGSDRRTRYWQFERRWNPDSPLRRAATAALNVIQSERGSLDKVELHGKNLNPSTDATVFVDLGLRYLSFLLRYIGDGCETWIEVVHPARKGPLLALVIEPADQKVIEARQVRSIYGGFFR